MVFVVTGILESLEREEAEDLCKVRVHISLCVFVRECVRACLCSQCRACLVTYACIFFTYVYTRMRTYTSTHTLVRTYTVLQVWCARFMMYRRRGEAHTQAHARHTHAHARTRKQIHAYARTHSLIFKVYCFLNVKRRRRSIRTSTSLARTCTLVPACMHAHTRICQERTRTLIHFLPCRITALVWSGQ